MREKIECIKEVSEIMSIQKNRCHQKKVLPMQKKYISHLRQVHLLSAAV